jgi:hypothetical protein
MTKEKLVSLTLGAFVLIFATAPAAVFAQPYNTQGDVNQSIQSQPVPMALNQQYVLQYGSYLQDTSGNEPAIYPAVNLTPGSNLPDGTGGGQDSRVRVLVEFQNFNSISRAIKRANAHFYLVLSKAADPLDNKPLTSCAGHSAKTCWATDFDGTDSRLWSDTPGSPAETYGGATVNVDLPYFAEPGTWSVYWKVIPTDEAGSALMDPALQLTNINPDTGVATSPMNFYINGLVAIDVSPTVVAYTYGGRSVVPGVPADNVTMTVNQKGNVQSAVRAYGSDWTCYQGDGQTPNGQTMPVAVTKFRAGSGLSAASNGVAMDKDVNGTNYIRDDSDVREVLPVSDGLQDGTVTTQGSMNYQNTIIVPPGTSGVCRANFINIASDTTGFVFKGLGALPILNDFMVGESLVTNGVAVSGNRAYVASLPATVDMPYGAFNQPGVLSIVDVTNKQSASALTTVTVGDDPIRVAIVGTNAFVLNYYDGTISVVDINPASANYATVTHLIDFSQGQWVLPQDMVASGNYVYLTTCHGELFIINADANSQEFAAITGTVSNVTTLNQGYCPMNIAVSGNNVFVANPYSQSMSVIDASNKSAPTKIAEIGVPQNGNGNGIAVKGSYAYLSSGFKGLSVVDVSTPATPSLVRTVTLPVNSFVQISNMILSGNLLWTEDWNTQSPYDGSLTTWDVTSGARPVALNRVSLGRPTARVAVDARYAYIAGEMSHSLQIVDSVAQ